MSDVPKFYTETFVALKRAYPRADVDGLAAVCATIAKAGIAFRDPITGAVAFTSEVRDYAPRLAPAPIVTEHMDERQKCAVGVQLLRRAEHTPPQSPKRATPVRDYDASRSMDEQLETGKDLTERQKLQNAKLLTERAEGKRDE